MARVLGSYPIGRRFESHCRYQINKPYLLRWFYKRAFEPLIHGDIDHKCGHLLWLSRNLLAQDLAHEIRCLTADGVIIHDVTNDNELMTAMDDLLCHPMAPGGTLRDRVTGAVWQYHIGGDADEA